MKLSTLIFFATMQIKIAKIATSGNTVKKQSRAVLSKQKLSWVSLLFWVTVPVCFCYESMQCSSKFFTSNCMVILFRRPWISVPTSQRSPWQWWRLFWYKYAQENLREKFGMICELTSFCTKWRFLKIIVIWNVLKAEA